MINLINVIIFVLLLATRCIVGQWLERSHYKSMRKGKNELYDIPTIATKVLPEQFDRSAAQIVVDNIVISVDFFKKFIARLRYLVDGRDDSLIDRVRREVTLRMKEQAK